MIDLPQDAPKWPWELETPKVDPDELNEALDIRAEFLALMASPGWARLRDIVEKQVSFRDSTFRRQPLDSLHDVPKQQFTMGEAAGMEFLLALPQVMVEQANEVIDQAKQMEEEQDDV